MSTMANTHLLKSGHIHACKLLLLSLLLLVAGLHADAQSSPNKTSDDDNNKTSDNKHSNFHPTKPTLIAVVIGIIIILGVYTIYIRRWRDERLAALDHATAVFPSTRQRGLDPALLDSFPTMLYSDVKGHKIGKGALECAVCLNEFDDNDSLRLLPTCSHAFHEDCIDAWLDKHVTCPVCRADLEKEGPPALSGGLSHGPQEVVAADYVEVAMEVGEEERKREMKELARIASRTRRGSLRRPKRLLRWNTTGHIGEDLERYTLRLPESVRKDIVAARRLQRERSFPVRYSDTDHQRIAAAKVCRRGGEAGGSGRPSFRLGRSARWPSFLLRSQQ